MFVYNRAVKVILKKRGINLVPPPKEPELWDLARVPEMMSGFASFSLPGTARRSARHFFLTLLKMKKQIATRTRS